MEEGWNELEKMNVLVSIIVPVYNTALNMLDQCISSVLRQSFQNFELIIVNDCSTNQDVLRYLNSLENVSDQIRVFHLTQNKGISGSRNYGIDRAVGKWICFLDHDDWWEKEYLKELVSEGEATDTDMVVSGYTEVDENGTVVKYMPEKRKRDFFASPWFVYSYAVPWNRLIKKDFLMKHHIQFPEGCLTEDITFNITCNSLAHNPKGIPCYGYCNRVNQSSTSRSRKFISMSYEEMPFDSIEENCILSRFIKEKERRKIHKAAVAEQLAVIICVFARESDRYTQRMAREKASWLIRKYMPGYVRRAYEYNRYMPNRMTMKIIYLGYMISIRFHVDGGYCILMHTLLRIFMRFV